VTQTCETARPLVPSYLDGQLSELQASPLRAHLLACPACRETAKDEKLLKRWFDFEPERVSVPAGFAARVARRALAGDPGLLVPEPPVARPRRTLLPVLLVATAAAAVLLFVLALAIQRQNLPAGNGLEADTRKAPPWIEAPGHDLPLPLDAEGEAEER
jgi:predicted anti-sigma-YlaC factor YlaD